MKCLSSPGTLEAICKCLFQQLHALLRYVLEKNISACYSIQCPVSQLQSVRLKHIISQFSSPPFDQTQPRSLSPLHHHVSVSPPIHPPHPPQIPHPPLL